MRGLGYKFNFAVGINPVANLAAGANTGKRVHMRNYETLAVVFHKQPASAGTDSIILTLREHNANTSGTSQNLAAIGDWYYQSTAAALAGTEVWTEATQALGATLTLADAGPIKAANEAVVIFEIEAPALSAGFEWLSVDIADPGAGGTIAGGLWLIPHGLKIQRRPDLLAQVNA